MNTNITLSSSGRKKKLEPKPQAQGDKSKICTITSVEVQTCKTPPLTTYFESL